MTTLYRSDFIRDLITELNLHKIMRGFHRTFATGVACRQGSLTPPDTWSRPIIDWHMFYLLRPIFFPNLSLFSGPCTLNIPHYILPFAWFQTFNNPVNEAVIKTKTKSHIQWISNRDFY